MGLDMKQQEFLEIEGETIVTPLRTDSGNMLGWTMARNGITLQRARNGARTFKELSSIAVFCVENGISEFKVSGL